MIPRKTSKLTLESKKSELTYYCNLNARFTISECSKFNQNNVKLEQL